MPSRPGKAFQHRVLRRLLVEMHRLRIEFRGKGEHLLARDMARPIAAETAKREIFEAERHDGDLPRIAGEEARLWPYFAAISSHGTAWRACDLAQRPVRR